MKNRQGFQSCLRLIGWQLAISILCGLGLLLISGPTAAYSALLGGAVSILPNVYFAKKLFRYQGAHAAKQIVRNFYKGEAGKLLLSAVLFAIVFTSFNIVPLVFFIVYMVTQMMFWFAPLIIDQ